MNKIIVVNKKTYMGKGEYVARPSILGNPFTHLNSNTAARYKVSSIEEAVIRYDSYIREKLASKDVGVCSEMNRLYKIFRERDLVLICWCITDHNPYHCHGNVIKTILEEAMVKS